MEKAFIALLLVTTVFAFIALASLYRLREIRLENKSLTRIIKLYRN